MSDKKNIEFVDAKIEREEITGFSLKRILDGSLLTIRSFVRQIPFILFGVLLCLVYIANRYHAEKVIRQIHTAKNQIKDLRAEEITAASELMNMNTPSKIEELVKVNQLELKFPEEPPYKIIKKR